MSVYTSVSSAQMAELMHGFMLGELIRFKGIEAGIENTNYFVTTHQGEYVLTIFEHQDAAEVQELVRLARHLGSKAMQVPAPINNLKGEWLISVQGKPAILCPRLAGSHIEQPQVEHCRAIGYAIAELHLKAQDLQPRRPNNRGLDWWLSAGPELTANLPPAQQTALALELKFQAQHTHLWQQLPSGWIHGDLFHDNALFETSPTGFNVAILDLYNACTDAFIYDLAVIANDWCCNHQGELDQQRVDALWQGYQQLRPLTALEQQHWPLALRGGALRFWLSRLLTIQLQQHQSGELALQKDPNEFYHKLTLRQQLV